jgi:glycosyltransferase involved in cell wall biosynthesis
MLRRELGLGQGTKIIGMVAYMYAPKRYLGQRRGLKGHEDFIDAAAFCLQQTSDILFVVVGGPWNGAVKYERRIREYAAKRCADRVIFLGTRNDVADLYPDFDVVVHPSHSENVGGAVESLLLGVPTIATRVGGFPDLVHDGKTGWLIPPRDPKYLAETIERVLADPTALEKAEHGKNLAHQLFDVKRTAAEVRSIYDNIVGQVK